VAFSESPRFPDVTVSGETNKASVCMRHASPDIRSTLDRTILTIFHINQIIEIYHESHASIYFYLLKGSHEIEILNKIILSEYQRIHHIPAPGSGSADTASRHL